MFQHYGRLSHAVRLMPDFCWMTLNEAVAYVEQIYDSADFNSIAVTLRDMEKRGEMETKWVNKYESGLGIGGTQRGRRIIKMYKRPSLGFGNANFG